MDHFSKWKDFLSIVAIVLRQVCRKWILRVHKNILKTFVNCVFVNAARWTKVFPLLVELFFDVVDKIKFYVSIGTIWEKIYLIWNIFFPSFSDMEPERSGFFTKFFRRGCWNLDSTFPESKFEAGNYLLKKSIFFHLFRTMR